MKPISSPASSLPSPRWRTASVLAALAGGGLLLLPPAIGEAPPETAHGNDEKAVEIARRALDAMGGEEAWSSTRYLRFDFFGFRLHHWDRHQGLHRLEGKTRDGQEYVVLSSLHESSEGNRKGRAWLDGEALEGEALGEWLERAHGAWVNDTYWLLMPYKLLDPGVFLAYEGQEELDGRAYDKVKLTFENVGLTPGGSYWAWFDTETGLMHRWSYFLESWEEGREPTAWIWKDWGAYGSIQLSPTRIKVDDASQRELGRLAAPEHLDPSVFTSPEPPAE